MPKIHQNRKILNYPKTMLNCKLMITVQSTYYLKGDKMLNGFEESIKDMELTDEVRAALIKSADKLSTGLSDKNNDLISKNKSLSDMSASEKELALSEHEKLTALEKFKSDSELKDAETASNYDKAKTLTAEAHQASLNNLTESNKKALEDANTISSGFESKLKAIVVDQEITKELIELDVAKEFQEMAHDSIKNKTTFTDGKAMVGDKSLSEYMKEWADSPAGKASRLAANNSGGNASGSNKGSGGGNSNGKSWADMKTPQEQAAYLEAKKTG